MNVEDVIDEIIADLAAGLVDKSDEEIIKALDSYDLDEDTISEILDMVSDLREAESITDEHTDPLNIDVVDKLADSAAAKNPLSLENIDKMADQEAAFDKDAKMAEAQDMANEDNSEVTVTEEDKDNDGDADKVTIEKDDPEDDPLELDFSGSDDSEEESNADEEEDKPHDTNVLSDSTQKNIIGTLSNFRW